MKSSNFKRIISAALLISGLCSFNVYAATVKDELAAGMEPIGKCLYVWGGGWNEADDGSGEETMEYGISTQWESFYNANDSDYDYNDSRYQIHDGLDCSGYIGWVMYQLFGDEYSDTGYVFGTKSIEENFCKIFGSTVINHENVVMRRSGDIMVKSGHVFIVLGQCEDGSFVLLHSSPPSVSICGTKTADGSNDSQAVELARKYMERYFPKETEKYKNYSRIKDENIEYLTDYDELVWSDEVLSDPDNYRNMSAEDILIDFFENIKIYIDDTRFESDRQPYIYDDRVYLPLRAISEKLNAEIVWNAENKTAKVSFDDKYLEFDVKNGIASIDGQTIDEDFQLKNDFIYVPVSIFSNAGIDVKYEDKTKSVYITK